MIREIFNTIASYFSGTIRIAMLLSWIVVLIIFALLAASKQASELILSFYGNPIRSYYFSYYTELSPREYLQKYLSISYGKNPPPLESIIDQLVFNPYWSDKDIISSCPFQEYDKDKRRQWIEERYFELFSKIGVILSSLAKDPKLDIDRVNEITVAVPTVFRRDGETFKPGRASLPLEVKTWIKDERNRQEIRRQQLALIDTFFLLMVLGAFGSLIFLTKDYIDRGVELSIASLIFRPILGMFLAMAVFIVDIFAHSVVSTANILQIRSETLYLLALAAGMLSEQAYDVVALRAQAALEKFKEPESIKETGSITPSNHSDKNDNT